MYYVLACYLVLGLELLAFYLALMGKTSFIFFFVFLKNKQKKSQDDDQLILG